MSICLKTARTPAPPLGLIPKEGLGPGRLAAPGGPHRRNPASAAAQRWGADGSAARITWSSCRPRSSLTGPICAKIGGGRREEEEHRRWGAAQNGSNTPADNEAHVWYLIPWEGSLSPGKGQREIGWTKVGLAFSNHPWRSHPHLTLANQCTDERSNSEAKHGGRTSGNRR